MMMHDQITDNKGQPFVQRLRLGKVVIGEICIGKVHHQKDVNVNKMHILNDRLCTTFPICHNNFNIKDNDHVIFLRTPIDKKIGPSVEDRNFVMFMDAEFHKYTDGYCSVSLLFKKLKLVMP